MHPVADRQRATHLWTALALVAPPLALVLASLLWLKPERRPLAKTLAVPALLMLGGVVLVLGLTTFIARMAG